MALGIKKITESLVEDSRSLIMIGTLNNDNIDFDDNKAVPTGALITSIDGTVRLKTNEDVQIRINGDTTLELSSVTNKLINNSAVTTEKINDKAVTTAKINNSAVTTEKINNSAVITEKINDRAVTTVKLANESVVNNKLATDSVSTVKIQKDAVVTEKIKDSAITEAKLRNRSVTSNKIALGTIQAVHIADYEIIENKLAPNSVTTPKIKDGNITLSKLNNDVLNYIGREIKNYCNNKIATELEKFKRDNIPKHLIVHDGLFDLDGKNGSTSLVNLTCSGDIQGNRVFFMTYQDLAEGYEPGEILEPGDIVAIHEDGKVYKAESIDDCVVGVVSDEFANCLGATKEELFNGSKIAVGMIGKIHVKVKGPVKLGQQIAVSLSDAGVGCPVGIGRQMGIGKALESVDCDFDEVHKILVQVRPM